jgi:hypothetical protein
MCNCINKSAFKEDFSDKIEKKMGLRTEIEGLRKHKAYLDEKYKEVDAILSEKQKKVSKNTAKHL